MSLPYLSIIHNTNTLTEENPLTNSTFTYPAPQMEEILAEVQDAKDIPEMVKSFSDLNLSTDRYGGRTIASPGKFESEYAYLPWFYSRYLNGEGEVVETTYTDGSTVEHIKMNVSAVERAVFPELNLTTIIGHTVVRETISFFETEHGFVIEYC